MSSHRRPVRTRATLTIGPAAVAVVVGCSTRDGELPTTTPQPGKYLYVWAGPHAPPSSGAGKQHDAMAKGENFVTVLDADPASATYGKVLGAGVVPGQGVMAHHTEYTLPAGKPMFADDYGAGRVVLIDVSIPLSPRMAGRIDSVPGFRKPHSFARLPNGNVIASLQFGNGSVPGDPGGLGEFDPTGRLLRTASAADSAFPGARIRTYGVEVLPAIDRAVTTSAPMDTERTADVIQVWRLSDLHLLKTIAAPAIAGDSASYYPFEVRALADGRTVFVNTYNCGFYVVSGLDTPAPSATRVHSMPGRGGCSVPARVGRFWVMPVAYGHVVVSLDLADPQHPKEVSELATDSTFLPHWSSADPGSDRIVVVGQDDGEPRVLMAHLDQTTGRLTWDDRFHDPGSPRRGVSFASPSWPHGTAASVMPHGAVFGR